MSIVDLNNEELIKKVRMWVDELCRTGGKGWSLQVPVNMERDPDVLISELCNRFEEILQAIGPEEEDGPWAEGFAERCGEKSPACDHSKLVGKTLFSPLDMKGELCIVCLLCGAVKLKGGEWSAPTMEPVPTPAPPNCLLEADKIINGERQDMYGSPEDSFEIIAGYWNTFLKATMKKKEGCLWTDLLSPLDVVNMMILFKQARKLGQKPCRDNYVDSCGYEGIGADRLMKEE